MYQTVISATFVIDAKALNNLGFAMRTDANISGNQALGSTEGVPVEIRRNPDGTIDEIVAENCMVHIEQMSADGWFMSLDAADGTQWRFWFGAKNRKSAVVFRHDETIPAIPRKEPTP